MRPQSKKRAFFKNESLSLGVFLGGMWSLNHVKSSLNISLSLQSRYSHLSSSFPTKMWPVVPNREEESKRRSTNWLHLAPIELKAPCMICRHWWCDEGQDDRTNHWIVVSLLVEPTHLKQNSQNWLFPQVRMKMKNILQPPPSCSFVKKKHSCFSCYLWWLGNVSHNQKCKKVSTHPCCMFFGR